MVGLKSYSTQNDYYYIWWQMLTRLSAVIILQYIQIFFMQKLVFYFGRLKEKKHKTTVFQNKHWGENSDKIYQSNTFQKKMCSMKVPKHRQILTQLYRNL